MYADCTHHVRIGLGLLICAVAMSGCALSPYLDDQFGQALKATTRQQSLGDDSGGPLISASHQDGKAAKASMDRYFKSFEAPAAATPGVIGRVGGNGGGLGY